LARQIETDDGLDRLTRQKRAIGLRTWTDKTTGMIRLHGEYDPETGAVLVRRLDNQVDALFHDRTPPDCPPTHSPAKHSSAPTHFSTSPTPTPAAKPPLAPAPPRPTAPQAPPSPQTPPSPERRHGAAPMRRPFRTWTPTSTKPRPGRRHDPPGPSRTRSRSIVIDLRTLTHGFHPDTRLDCGIDGIQLPLDTIRRLALYADIIPVLLDTNGVVLKMGRTRRLATRDQRRAIRAMYRTCAIPGCRTHVRHCEPHHITDWDHGGHTDLEILVPICKHHHDIIHARHWTLSLSPDRRLTITKPDGTTMTTGPPSEQWR
jgi:hypothetical protein